MFHTTLIVPFSSPTLFSLYKAAGKWGWARHGHCDPSHVILHALFFSPARDEPHSPRP